MMSMRQEAVFRLGGALAFIVVSAMVARLMDFSPGGWLLGALGAAFAIRLIVVD